MIASRSATRLVRRSPCRRRTSRTGCGLPAGPAARRSAAAPPAPWPHGPWRPALRPGRAGAASRRAGSGAAPARPRTAGRWPSSRRVDHRELALGIGRVEIGDELDDAAARVLHAERDAQQLGLGGAQRRRRIALHRAMVERARGREAERAGAHRLGGQRAHLRHLLGRRLLQLGGALAHDEHAQRAVRQLRAEIHVARPRVERIEILAERFPRPASAPRRAPRRECPRRLPSARSGAGGPRSSPARSRRRNCPSPPW